MRAIAPLFFIALVAGCVSSSSPSTPSSYVMRNVTITWLGHASFMINGSKLAYIDPFVLPPNATKADYILVTHNHFDHCDPEKIRQIQRADTQIIAPLDCVLRLKGRTNSIRAGETFGFQDIFVNATQAYNEHHPKGTGVGYLLTIDGIVIYDAGDTDFVPELDELADANIDVALVPVGGNYTMDEAAAARLVNAIKPRAAIPMHYNSGLFGIPGIDADAGQFSKAAHRAVVLVPAV